MDDASLPDVDTIHSWIEKVFGFGVRRPGYEADIRTEAFILEQFRDMGLEAVRREPVELPCWSPEHASLTISGPGETFSIPCFPLPHCAPTRKRAYRLQKYEPGIELNGDCALVHHTLMQIPATMVAGEADVPNDLAGELVVPLKSGGTIIDPRGSLRDSTQILPFSPLLQAVMEPAMQDGAGAFIGVLDQYPGDSYRYYVPYDGLERPIPGLWVRGSDGKRIHALLAAGEVTVEIEIRSERKWITSHNIIGELPGVDGEAIVIGSHHDGPWSSAVEDASGIAMVLAQAQYWSKQPGSARPHHLVFLLNAGHMAGGAGCKSFIEQHREMMDRIVLSIHLEHAARECRETDGEIRFTGEPEPRWFFTSHLPRLRASLRRSLEEEGIDRALIIAPDTFGELPTTDGGAFHPEKVPLVDFLTAPFYLFDEMDTLDKIHRESLVPITRAMVRLIEDTMNVSATDMRRT